MSVKLWIFSYWSVSTFVLGAQKNGLIETVLLSTHNIYFGWEIKILKKKETNLQKWKQTKNLSVKLWIFSYWAVSTFVLGAQKNRLNETVLLSTHNIYFGWEIKILKKKRQTFKNEMHKWRQTRLENLKFLKHPPDCQNNVKIGQGKLPGGVLWYFHTYVGSVHFFGFKNLNFNIFLGFQKNEYFFGVLRFWGYFFGVITKLG